MKALVPALVLFLSITPSVASADVLPFTFAGTVDFVDPALSSAFALGDPLSGTFAFDSNGQATSCGFNFKTYCSAYPSPLQTFSGTLGSSYDLSGTFYVRLNTPPSGPPDAWELFSDPPSLQSSLTAPSVNGNAPASFKITLVDPSGTALDQQLVPPVFQDYAERRFQLAFLAPDGVSSFLVGGTITSLAAVPEPGTTTLLVAGLGVLLGARRRRRQCRPSE
jgi:hypothetical protein